MNKPLGSANILSFDVEEWFHLRHTEDFFPPEKWSDLRETLPRCLEAILDLLASTSNRATFFWLGWCAERRPDLVGEIARAGHEIACHGYSHRALDGMEPEEFRAELRRSRALLEDITGKPVRGFRAPSLSLGPATAWALEILAEEGFAYDSSLMTTALRFNKPRKPLQEKKPRKPTPRGLARLLRTRTEPWRWGTGAGPIIELPLSVLPCGPINLPFAGGLFFRCAPYWAVAATVRSFNRQGRPAIFYAHPWEFDPKPPRMPRHVAALERFAHRFRLASGRRKYRRLLREFRFITAAEAIENHLI